MKKLFLILKEWVDSFFGMYENIKYSRYGYSQFKIVVNDVHFDDLPYLENYSTAKAIYVALMKECSDRCKSVALYGYYYPTDKWECVVIHKPFGMATLDASGKIPTSYLPSHNIFSSLIGVIRG